MEIISIYSIEKITFFWVLFIQSSYIILLTMSNDNYPQPPSHKTFNFGTAIIDSNFDSGNCSHAEKLSSHHVFFKSIQFNLWIGVDHPKNKYRTWFHFSVSGFSPGNTLTFTIKNMQNQVNLDFNLVKAFERRISPSLQIRLKLWLEANSRKSQHQFNGKDWDNG